MGALQIVLSKTYGIGDTKYNIQCSCFDQYKDL